MHNVTIGHNRPPSELEILQERLLGYTGEQAEFKRLAAVPVPEKVEDEEQAGKISAYIKAANGLKKTIGDIHKKEKSVYLDCGRAVDGWKNDYECRIADLVRKASVPLQAFLDRKAEEERQRQLELARKAREEAERLAAEAAAHEAEGIEDTAAELMDMAVDRDQKSEMILNSALQVKARARSGMGATASQRVVWQGTVESAAALDLEKLRPYFTDDALQKAVNAFVRDGGRELRGAVIEQVKSLEVR